jgi:NitT/TauT family transport system substrate-binding protein
MQKKVIIQPWIWVVLIIGGLSGAFFGIKAMVNNGSLGKISSAIAPKKADPNALPDSIMAKANVAAVKLDGKEPLIVAINVWVGYAPLIYFNNGLSPNSESRFVKEFGVPVQIEVMDDFTISRAAWKSDKVHVISNTADVLPTELPALTQFKPKVFLQVDWSRGGDKIVVRPGINSIGDLKGKTIAMAIGSPSQTLIIRAIETGEVAYSDLKIVPVNIAPLAAEAFKNGQVDAAIVWAPDDETCLSSVPGAKVLISTKEAKYIIADVFYAKDSYIQSHRQQLEAFTAGILKASKEINSDPAARAKAGQLISTAFNLPSEVMNLDFARFTTYGDNVNFFNLSPTQCRCIKGEDLYTKMASEFFKIGLAPKDVPIWRDITDISILRAIEPQFTTTLDGSEDQQTFTKPTEKLKTVDAVATKRVTINFPTGIYQLNDESKYIIDREFGAIAKSFAGYRIRIEGNTDIVGSRSSNVVLSKNRAKSVADYLQKTYGFDRNRFVIVGNGPDSPIASNETEEGKAKNRRTDFELIAE